MLPRSLSWARMKDVIILRRKRNVLARFLSSNVAERVLPNCISDFSSIVLLKTALVASQRTMTDARIYHFNR